MGILAISLIAGPNNLSNPLFAQFCANDVHGHFHQTMLSWGIPATIVAWIITPATSKILEIPVSAGLFLTLCWTILFFCMFVLPAIQCMP